MTENWTPGPWRVEEDTTLVWGACQLADDGSIDFLGIPVAQAQYGSNWERHYRYKRKAGEEEANARLIAAAPDLYEALKALLDKVGCGTALDCDVCDHACAALAKARGEE